MSDKTKFSTTILAITGLITAVGGLITILINAGYLGGNHKKVEVKDKPIDEVLYEEEKTPKKEETMIVYTSPKKVVVEPTSIAPNKKKKTYNLTGYWLDANNPNGKYYLNHERPDKISFTEYSNFFGEWTASAQGVGSISGRKINLPFTTYLEVTGYFEGELSEDGKSISGKVKYHSNGMEAMLYITKE